MGVGTLMFLLLLFKRNKKQGDLYFLGWILVTLGQIAFYEVTIYRFAIEGFLAIVVFGLPLLGAPMLFLYIQSLTGHLITPKLLITHLGVYGAYVLLFFALQQKDDITLIAINGFFEPTAQSPWWMYHYAVPLAISGLVYCTWDLVLLNRHRKRIRDFFSFEERINLKWVSYVVNSYFMLFLSTSFLVFGAVQFQLFPIEKAFAFVAICLSFMMIAFGFYGFRQTAVFSNREFQQLTSSNSVDTTARKASYSKSGLTPEKVKSLAHRLKTYMETEKPFLNEDLSLPLLAEQSEISRPYLSQIINQEYQMNFYDFVNRYRVEEAKERLISEDHKHLSVLGIAFDCGFKSKSSFNRYFKKYSGVSPSEFKNQPQ